MANYYRMGIGQPHTATDENLAPVRLSEEFMPSQLTWLSARGNGTYETVTIPSPYTPAHVLHPSIVYVPNGWNGYVYWCAFTPYPDSDAEYENPCVIASCDGQTWVARGSQPLVPSPAAAAYNSELS